MATKIKIALLAALAAVMFGLPSVLGVGTVPTAQAAAGDICAIQGPTTITLGSTVYYAIRVEDTTSMGTLIVDVDDLTGDADITSVWFENINATNTVGNVDLEEPFLGPFFDELEALVNSGLGDRYGAGANAKDARQSEHDRRQRRQQAYLNFRAQKQVPPC